MHSRPDDTWPGESRPGTTNAFAAQADGVQVVPPAPDDPDDGSPLDGSYGPPRRKCPVPPTPV